MIDRVLAGDEDTVEEEVVEEGGDVRSTPA